MELPPSARFMQTSMARVLDRQQAVLTTPPAACQSLSMKTSLMTTLLLLRRILLEPAIALWLPAELPTPPVACQSLSTPMFPTLTRRLRLHVQSVGNHHHTLRCASCLYCHCHRFRRPCLHHRC